MVDISKFLESERKAQERDPEKYARERAEDARRAYKDHERFENSKLMERFERMQKSKKTKGNPSAIESKSKMNLGSWMQPSVDADGNPLKKAPAKPPKKEGSKGGSGGRGSAGGGGGGMNPIDLERVPGKRPLKMKKGGSVKSSASKRADGIAKKGKTRGRMV
jgi:hypothetical protein